MSEQKGYLIIDIGTGNVRVAITDQAGNVLHVEQAGNLLEIEVTNLWPNRLIGDAALEPEKRLTKTNIVFKKDAPLLSSGLLGPVIIQEASEI